MDRREFQKSLEAYYREKGKPPPPCDPQLAGKTIPLFQLFERVTKLGGSHVIGREDKWQDILQAFNLTPPSASLAYGLRKIYKQYLESFEKLQLYGEEPNNLEELEEVKYNPLSEISDVRKVREDSYSQSYDRHVRRRITTHSTAGDYTYDPNFRSLYKPDPPEWRMINSLHSCLPNEVNFVLNTLLLYCSDHQRKRLRLERAPHLLDSLMLHAGCPNEQDLALYQSWEANSGLRLVHFWEQKLAKNENLTPLLGLDPHFAKTRKLKDEGFINGEPDREGQRIRHILVIIRNICQDQRDIHIVRRSEAVMLFILRCAFVDKDVGLVEQALETISILIQSDRTDKDLAPPIWVQEPYISLILELISTLIQKPDKLIQIRILEIYSQLLEQTILEWSDDGSAPSYDNESQKARAQYLRSIIPDLTENILPLLTLPDCELLIASLEALNAIARSPMGRDLARTEPISLLVDLLSFSSRNCDFSRLRFYGPRQPEVAHPPLIVQPRIPTRRVIPNISNSAQANQNSPHRTPVPTQNRPALQQQNNPNKPTTPQKPQRNAAPTSRENTPNAKEEQALIQSHQWKFARSFIERRLEVSDSDSSMISRQGIFLEYTSIAKQQGKIDGVSGVPILSVPEFTRLIRELFPTSQLINDAQNRQVFSGIQVKEPNGKSNKKVVENSSTPPVNGFIPNGSSPKENGHNHANGVSSYDEDSNHSQQSLDSVGGGGGTGMLKNKIIPKSESLQPADNNEKENDPVQANGQKSELSTKTEVDEISSPPQKSPRLSNGEKCEKDKVNGLNGHTETKRVTENDHKESLTNGVSKNPSTAQKRTDSAEPPKEGGPSAAKQRVLSQGAPAGYRVLMQNAGHFLFDDFTDDREDCLTRSVRIQAALVLLSLAENSDKYSESAEKNSVVEMVSRFEERISLIAASRQDASPVLARLLAFIP